MASSSKVVDMVTDSNEAMELKLIQTREDIENDSLIFKPVMSHQIFGAQETIYGYTNLKIKLYFSAAYLTPYLAVSYTDKVNPNRQESVEADNIKEILTKELGITMLDNLDEFASGLDNEYQFSPFGILEDSFVQNLTSDSRTQSTFEVYFCEVTTPRLIGYHKRLQTFILWFIDAASYIHVDDDKWKFFLIFEKTRVSGDVLYAVAGYATVYEYYSYPTNIRPRLSQMLILPPYQRQGLGASLLNTIYNHYKTISNVTDITVEDPSDDFVLLRDYVDCKNCMVLPEFQSSELWAKRFTPEIVKAANAVCKINKKQARRVYEILKLRTVRKEDTKQYQNYRLEVKGRLNLPNHNEQNKIKKLEKFMKTQDIDEIRDCMILSNEQRLATLDKSYKQLEELYERVIKRLAHL